MKCHVAIADIHDMAADILAFLEKKPSKKQLFYILKDNPLRQYDECNPMGIIRVIKN